MITAAATPTPVNTPTYWVSDWTGHISKHSRQSSGNPSSTTRAKSCRCGERLLKIKTVAYLAFDDGLGLELAVVCSVCSAHRLRPD